MPRTRTSSRSSAGRPTSPRRRSRTCWRYHAKYYVPNNAFIVAVGDFDSAALTAQIRDAFETIERGPLPPAVRAIEPPQHGARRVELERPAQLPFVAMAYHVPNLQQPRRLGAGSAVGDPRRRRQRPPARRAGLPQPPRPLESGVSYDYTSIDPGLFTVYAQPLPGKTAAQSETALSSRDRAPAPRAAERARAGEGEERHRVELRLRPGLALLSGHAARRVRARRRLAQHRRLPARRARRHRRRHHARRARRT